MTGIHAKEWIIRCDDEFHSLDVNNRDDETVLGGKWGIKPRKSVKQAE